MDLSIAAILAQDGITTGAIYALLALALVLVFSVTRVIFIPQGEFVAFGALTLASLQTQKFPMTAGLTLALGLACLAAELVGHVRGTARGGWRGAAKAVLRYGLLPGAVCALGVWSVGRDLGLLGQLALSLAIVVPMGPLIYRLVYQPLANATVLVLLIVSVGVHFALVGLGLAMFGAEGQRTTSYTDARFSIGNLAVSGQSLMVIAVSVLLIIGLYLYFERSLSGKALRATAVNRLGARLVGIGTTQAGALAFTLAAAMGAVCGILIAPITTVYYESGFLIGLKGFVGAIIGGLVSYPLAAAGALLVGLLESYASFWASAFKEVIVFTLIIPVLLWRSLTSGHVEDE